MKLSTMKKFEFFLIIGFILSFNAFAQKKDKKNLAAPVVVLTFDDAVISHYTFVAPLLKKYHFGGTFFICEFPLTKPDDSAKYMNWAQIKELNDMGFEIGNHTHTHKHVNKMKRDQMMDEIGYIDNKCKSLGIPKPVSFAYPGYDTDSLSQVVLKEMGYKYARTGGRKVFEPTQCSPLLIPSFSSTGIDSSARERVMGILKAAQPGQIIVFTIHGVPDTAHPKVATAPELFSEYIKYMSDNHFIVIAMRDLDKYMK
jgi:peptidoglycan-N-acetylglucosamine deacetylase